MKEELSESKSLIMKDSEIVDDMFIDVPAKTFRSYNLSLPVTSKHKRAKDITETKFLVKDFQQADMPGDSYYLLDSSLRKSFITAILRDKANFVEAKENTVKEIVWLNRFIAEEIPDSVTTIVGIGGGVLLSASSYIAEAMKLEFISVPTTVMALADAAIGGLVRMNKLEGSLLHRSFYKSVYEPSQIIFDMQFIDTLPETQIRYGLSEIIKHGVWQSPNLLEYMVSAEFQPFTNQVSLLKAICWTVALKSAAIKHDPDSEFFGGEILRGGHQLARTIEEQSDFRIAHGQAVSVGIYEYVIQNSNKLALLDSIYSKFNLPRSQADITSPITPS